MHSLVVDDDSAVVFVRADHHVPASFELGEALTEHLKTACNKVASAVYWKFPKGAR